MAKNPKVNGHYKSFASIKLYRDATEYYDFSEINYKTTVERGEVRTSGRKRRGWTSGTVGSEASIKLTIDEWAEMRNGLGAGYLDAIFPLIVVHQEIGDDVVHTDELVGCRIASVDKANSQGTDATAVSVELNIIEVIEDGMAALAGEESA